MRGIELSKELCSILAAYGFTSNPKKLRVQERPEDRLTVTGLVVTDRVTVPKVYRHTTRAILSRWQLQGIDALAHQPFSRYNSRELAKSVEGRIAYIGQVEGATDQRYKRLRASYEMLAERDLSW